MTVRNTATEDGRLFQDFDSADHCQDCAACCRYPRVSFYHGELDTQPGGFVPAHLAQPLTPHLACMKGTEAGRGRCIALDEAGHCTIYAHRPSPCREFLAILPDGHPNPECERLRKALAHEAGGEPHNSVSTNTYSA